MSTPRTFRDKVAAYFQSKPNVWIDGMALEQIGGRYAWRSRISDCRKELGMDIRNRQQRMTDAEGKTWTVSWYMFVPPTVVSEPAPANDAHDLNQWSLR